MFSSFKLIIKDMDTGGVLSAKKEYIMYCFKIPVLFENLNLTELESFDAA